MKFLPNHSKLVSYLSNKSQKLNIKKKVLHTDLRKLQITKTTTMQTRMTAKFSSPERDVRQRACVNLNSSASLFRVFDEIRN